MLYSPRMKKEIKKFFADMQDTEKCIIWPFNKTAGGYAKITINKEFKLVHRVICEKVNGAPPEKSYHAAHDCGNSSCVNPKHLSWKTASQNSLDKIKHGTMHLGENVYNASMTDETAKAIKFDTRKNRIIAKEYNVREDVVSNIKLGKSYKHV